MGERKLTHATLTSDLFVNSSGTGTPVVLVHVSLATGAEEWHSQRALADEGFRLLGSTDVAMGRARSRKVRISSAMLTTLPTSWARVRISWAILTGVSECSSQLPAVRMRRYPSRCWSQLQ
jgi:hypothetical protein